MIKVALHKVRVWLLSLLKGVPKELVATVIVPEGGDDDGSVTLTCECGLVGLKTHEVCHEKVTLKAKERHEADSPWVSLICNTCPNLNAIYALVNNEFRVATHGPGYVLFEVMAPC
jgi:hypothetical protein